MSSPIVIIHYRLLAVLLLSWMAPVTVQAQTGKVGIGTNTPAEELDVVGTIRTNEVLLYDSTGMLRFRLNADSGLFQMLANDTIWYSLSVNSPAEVKYVGSLSASNGLPFSGTVDVISQLYPGTGLQLWDQMGSTSSTFRDHEQIIIVNPPYTTKFDQFNMTLSDDIQIINQIHLDPLNGIILQPQNGVAINNNGLPALPSSVLDLHSAEGGFVPSWWTSTERLAIPSPANGLLGYDTVTESIWHYSPSGWIELNTDFSVPFSKSVSSTLPLICITNTGLGDGIKGVSNNNYGVYGQGAQAGVFGESIAGAGESANVNSEGGNQFDLGDLRSSTTAVYGVVGKTNHDSFSAGVFGHSTASNGFSYGVSGKSDSDSGVGVMGVSSSTTGSTMGIFGTSSSNSSNSVGVAGSAFGTGQVYGVVGSSSGTADGASGVLGQSNASSGITYGVQGITHSESNGTSGVYGLAADSSTTNYGVYGHTNSNAPLAAGVFGLASNTDASTTRGVLGITMSQAQGASGIQGRSHDGETHGVFGDTFSGIPGASGVFGWARDTGQTYGVQGWTGSATTETAGVYGTALSETGVTYGVIGFSDSSTKEAGGVLGETTAGVTYGVFGRTVSSSDTASGVFGLAASSAGKTFGVMGKTMSTIAGASGVLGIACSTESATYGVHGRTNSNAVDAAGILGEAMDSTGINYGVHGRTFSTNFAVGVYGEAVRDTGIATGVLGVTRSNEDDAKGVSGETTKTSGSTYGVEGFSNSEEYQAAGVRGKGKGDRDKAAAVNIHDGAITVSGAARPAGRAFVFIFPWTSVTDSGSDIIGHEGTVILSNVLIDASRSVIVVTAQESFNPRPFTANIVSIADGSVTIRVYAPGGTPPIGEVTLHYHIINDNGI